MRAARRLGLLCSGTDDGRALDVGRLPDAAAAHGAELLVVDARSPDAPRRACELGVPVWLTRFAHRPHGLEAARVLEDDGATVLNPAAGVRTAADQALTLPLLRSGGLPVPRFAVTDGDTTVAALVQELGLPMVVKDPFTSGGAGVRLVSDTDELGARLVHRPRLVCQEFLAESCGVDYRYLVIGGEVRAAMRREARRGEWRANLQLGATAACVDADREAASLAVEAAALAGLDVAGVDLIRTATAGWHLIELNPKPGWRIDDVCRVDSAATVLAMVADRCGWARRRP